MTGMIETYIYPAKCGDAARIRFLGTDGLHHNLFIDSGYASTYRDVISKEIAKIEKNGEKIDLWVITHIHDDHIGGAIKYLQDVGNNLVKDIVQEWLYNPPRESKKINLAQISSKTSISQGDYLYEYLKKNNKILKEDITKSTHAKNLFGLKMKFLSPSKLKLNELRDKYSTPYLPIERIENDEISTFAKSKTSDYDIKVESFDFNNWQEDSSIENGSSISMLIEYESHKSLWLADSHPNDIVLELKKSGYSPKNKIKCNVVKVSHHGSIGNTNSELLSLLNCTNYIITSNGENRYNLPAKETIARILRNFNRDNSIRYTIHFPHDNSTLRSIFSVDDSDIFKKWNFSIKYSSNSF